MPDEFGDMIFATNLRRLLQERGKKSIDLARFLGVSKQAMSGWINGARFPRMDKVDKMCVFLNCTRSDLMDAPKDEKPPAEASDPQTEIFVKLLKRMTPEQKQALADYMINLIATGNQ